MTFFFPSGGSSVSESTAGSDAGASSLIFWFPIQELLTIKHEFSYCKHLFSSNFQQCSAKSISLMFESLARLGDESLFFGGFPMIEMEDDAAAR